MKKLVLCLAIMSIALQAYCFNIGTNVFEFVFENTSIPNNNKDMRSILSELTELDIKIITSNCVNP
jgi:hypothetical protein